MREAHLCRAENDPLRKSSRYETPEHTLIRRLLHMPQPRLGLPVYTIVIYDNPKNEREGQDTVCQYPATCKDNSFLDLVPLNQMSICNWNNDCPEIYQATPPPKHTTTIRPALPLLTNNLQPTNKLLDQ
jgi:hypothetical protein